MIDLPIMRNHQSPPLSPPPDSIFKRDALVLQPGFMSSGSARPVGSSGALLVSPPPVRPGEDATGIGRPCPDETPDEPAHLGNREGQQVCREVEVLSP